MKKMIALVSVAMITLAGFAANPKNSWIASDNRILAIENIRFGTKNAFVVLENGEKMKVPMDKLHRYALNGKLYEKKTLYKDGLPGGETSFMQMIKSRNGYTLYKNIEFDYESATPAQPIEKFYVYRGDSLFLAVSEASIPSVFNFYGLTPIYM